MAEHLWVNDRHLRSTFNALITDEIADLHLCAAIDAHQCFPLSNVSESALTQFRQHYSNESVTKEDIFRYIYAILHHPGYRQRYADNQKRELPRIPLAPNFETFATAGKELAHFHLHYESLEPWPLEDIERKDVPFSQRVTKMKTQQSSNLHPGQRLTHSGRHLPGSFRIPARLQISP